jgi:2-polyprenyl-3-methyl-5-hydroxy-6-metoxy-1,4-benzoquinol methylase
LAFVYDTTIDPGAENNSHAFTLDIVGYNKRVLEVGCATGYFTKALSDRGCQVVGIEFDAEAAAVAEKWAERVVVGDLDAGTLWQELEGERFDAITFGDVLEHLRDPMATLRAAVRTLKPSGIVAISVPNVAHGDVRIALLKGAFPYRETGLLDRTHIRFFTKTGLQDLIKDAGLVLVETRRVVMPLFQSELEVKRENVPQATIKQILEDPEGETYQFVVKAVLDNGTRTLTTLADRVNELTDRAHDEMVRTALLHKEMALLRQEMQDHQSLEVELRELRRELDRSRRAAQDAQREAAESRQQVEAILHTKAFRLLAPLRRLYGRVRRVRAPRAATSESI